MPCIPLLAALPTAVRRAPCSVFLCLACWLPAPAADAAKSASGLWANAGVSGRLGASDESPWRWTAAAESRYADIGNGLHNRVFASALGYHVSDAVSVWLGAGRFSFETPSGRRRDENRLFEQISWSGPRFLDGRLYLRARAEQRNIEGAADRRHVLRLLARYQRPWQVGRFEYWAVTLEPFFDLNSTDWGGDTGLSQHRTTISTGLRASEALRIEVGIMQQFFWVEGGEDRANYLGQVTLRWRF